MRLILGSNSPRRVQLLASMGFEFTKKTANINEIVPKNINPTNAALFLSQQKSRAIEIDQNEILLTSDTIVLLENNILGKPNDKPSAIQMLTDLSGKTHEVITGVCIRTTDDEFVFDATTNVKFKTLSAWEIEYYVVNYQPFDKAGAYGIQEWIGQMGIEWIKGSYYNVVGLPTKQVFHHLTVTFGLKPTLLT